ncbi:hypothetical protein KIMH_01520 [Bombiscardovia apis]|uniref:Uncharacterized protein n=1 Tax=Bombiscardovia apis TaxID=2932182 RepID=A0ABM8BB65_9BIFI|nr:LPXTG cell wall anchor domain-containing protein [Bombiscardovia apis]BDR54041.1 hypothetical protein KIMH_01520 [Bombiscardovia apis]
MVKGKLGRLAHAKAWAGGVAAVVSLAVMLPAGAAFAGIGTGGGGVIGGGGGPGPTGDLLYLNDNTTIMNDPATWTPEQGWGDGSINYSISQIEAGFGKPFSPASRDAIVRSCRAAVSNAIADKSNGPATKARVVGIAATLSDSTIPGQIVTWGDNKTDFTNRFEANWAGMNPASSLKGWSAGELNAGHDSMRNQIQAVAGQPSNICMAYNEYQPPKPEYHLTVETEQQGGFPTAGGTQAVSDKIIAHASTAIREDVNGTSTLVWAGYNGAPARSVSKPARIHNDGVSAGPSFTPADFGWQVWPAGKFGYRLDVPKQGQMDAAVSLDENAPGESWLPHPPAPRKTLWNADNASPITNPNAIVVNGVPYVARISAQTAGSNNFWMYEVITDPDVFIGAADRDDVSKVKVTDAAGGPQVAQISIDRSQAGQVIVKAHPADGQPRELTLHVPTYPKATGRRDVVKDDSKSCWSGDNVNCLAGDHREITKVPPAPDKVWTVDEAGALVVADPGHTNNAGKDNKTFIPGSPITAVVNGRIPAGLTGDMAAYTLTDDWTNAAQYVDFSDRSKVKVYVDGVNRTSDFTITIAGTKTIAKAKPSMLAGTAHLSADKIVKLVISGKVKDVSAPAGQRLTNSGSETWGDETVPTNDPPVFVRTPDPNKVWVLDNAGGLAAQDEGKTSAKGKDNRVFVPGDAISSVVNGRLPQGLAANLSNYAISDDWSAAAQYVDFSDASKAKVYVDGVDRTGDFSIAVSGTKTIATAKPAILGATENLQADKVVKLIISGTVKDADVPDGVTFTNSGSETWGDKSVPTNDPPVFVRSPKPDKVWVLERAGALSAADPNHTNTVGEDTKVFLTGDEVGGVVNGKLPKGLAKDLDSYVIADDWTPAAPYVDFSNVSKTRVFIDGVDRTGDFTIKVQGTTTIATAKPAVLSGTENLPTDKMVKLYIGGTFKDATRTNGKLVQLTNKGYEQWNKKKVPTNEPPVFVWTPNPDKSWVGLENGDPMSDSEDYKLVIDPSKSNQTGADNQAFRQGDRVAAVVNATMPANLARVPNIVLSDDWKQTAKIVQAEVVSHIRIYDKDATTAEHSTIDAIDAAGRDVTNDFTITVNGTVATATPKPAYVASLQGMSSARQISMLIPFQVKFDPAGIRKDYGKQPGDQLDTCKNPNGSGLTNKGKQQAGHAPVDTNQPGICVTVPSIHKDVIGESSQGGSQESIDGKTVMPGQKVEYTVRVDPLIPTNDAYEVTKVAVSDTYDVQTVPDKQTLEITDLNTGQVIPRAQWTGAWDDAQHSFTATFADTWVQANWPKGSHPRILLRFEAKVKDDAPADHTIDNQAWLTINNSVTPSNKVKNRPPKIDPIKEDTQKDPSINIDGKTALLGDRLYYRISIDASDLTDSAYKVQRLGAIDDYDEAYLKLDEQAIQVLDPAGADVTSKLNIQVKDGIVYAFFKTVDTEIPATGETIKGDPQPADLQAYSTQQLDPLKDPAIDQSLLGKKYQLVLPVTVIRVKDGYTVKNTAKQITNSRESVTNTVANPLKPINPSKDVIVNVGGESVNHQTIYLHSQFLYRLNSSVLPANRAYPKITDWSIADKYDAEHDKPTEQWAVYANRDMHTSDGKLLAKRGERIGGKGFDSSAFGGQLFTYANKNGELMIAATALYLDLVSRDTGEQAWSAYVQCTRYKSAQMVKNWFLETVNGVQRPSNEVETKTPELAAAITIEKFDQASGPIQGDRNDPAEALENAIDGTPIVFRITNTGDVPVTGLQLQDTTVAGSGQVEYLQYPQDFSQLVLKPGEHVDVTGELNGVAEGDSHTNRAGASGKPVVDCPVVDDDPWDDLPGVQQAGECKGEEVVSRPDDWNGKRPPAQPDPLPFTGANVMIVCLLGLSALGASIPLLPSIRSRFHSRPSAQHASQ